MNGSETRGPVLPVIPPPLPPLPRSRAFSPYATWALLLGLLAVICLGPGPILGVGAIALGVLGLREIDENRGRLQGRALAITGIALGMLSFAVFGALLAAYMHYARVRVGETVTYAPTVTNLDAPEPKATAEPGPTVPDPPAAPLPTISTIATIGNITVIDIAPGILSLADELQAQRTAAAAHDQRLLVETVRSSCPPCDGVAQALGDPRMQKALAGVRLVRIDRDLFQEELQELKIPSDKVPSFFLLDSDLRVLDAIAGDEWDDDHPANIARVLGPFVRGTYTKRRTPWKAPRPSGTLL